mmetsp:Transcript_99068/g.212228  ORF Transcript_99068/g.212228 Transcript_99068/m.212228 type:complete len:220 (+) Transcript_99068:49-708(+)
MHSRAAALGSEKAVKPLVVCLLAGHGAPSPEAATYGHRRHQQRGRSGCDERDERPPEFGLADVLPQHGQHGPPRCGGDFQGQEEVPRQGPEKRQHVHRARAACGDIPGSTARGCCGEHPAHGRRLGFVEPLYIEAERLGRHSQRCEKRRQEKIPDRGVALPLLPQARTPCGMLGMAQCHMHEPPCSERPRHCQANRDTQDLLLGAGSLESVCSNTGGKH